MPSLHRQRFSRCRSRRIPARPIQRRVSVEQLENRVVAGEWLVPAGVLGLAAGAEMAAPVRAERRSVSRAEMTAEYRTADGEPRPSESIAPRTSRPSDRELGRPDPAGRARGGVPGKGKAAEELSPEEPAPARTSEAPAHVSARSAGEVYPLALFAPAKPSPPGPYRLPSPTAHRGQPSDHFGGSGSGCGPANMALFQLAAAGSEARGWPGAERGDGAAKPSDAASVAAGGVPASQLDPYYVIEWNDGLTLIPGAVEYDWEGDSVDLRAQTQGATVLSYAWELSQAPDAQEVTGQDTYRLQFRWGDVSGGEPSANRIGLTITYTDYSTTVLEYDFAVMDSGWQGGSGGGVPPVSVERRSVVTPDLISDGQDVLGGDGYSIAPATGELATSYILPAYDPEAPALGLQYNSEAAAPRPIFLCHYALEPLASIPDQVSARLTFNGDAGQEYSYAAGDLNPGDILQIALQADASTLATGRYAWQIDVTAHYGEQARVSSSSGEVTVINHSSDPAGDGWHVTGLTRLHPLDDGAVLDTGTGHSLWFEWDPASQEYLTPAGDFSALVRDADGTFARILKSGEMYRFDAEGKQISFTDRNGNAIEYAYDASGKLASIRDANGQVSRFSYSAGLLASITDPAGRTSRFTHDAGGRLTGAIQPDGAAWMFTYDADGRMIGRTDPRDATTSFSYGFAGRIGEVARGDGTAVSLVPFQTRGLLAPGAGGPSAPEPAVLLAAATSVYTDGRGNQWETRYDWTGFGRSTSTVDPLSYACVTHRGADGLETQRTDQLDRNTFFVRDALGNVLAVVHPDFSLELFAYNAFSLVTAHADTEGRLYTYEYDAFGNLTRATDPLGTAQSYTYTADGHMATSTDALGRTTKYVYDARDRLTELILPDSTPGNDADNPRERFVWDDAGNRVEATDPLGRAARAEYDIMGRLVRTILADETPGDWGDNPAYVYAYDARGNRIREGNPRNEITSWSYDLLSREIRVVDPMGFPTSYSYDAEGNRVAVTDPLNRTTWYRYDAVGSLVAVTDPLGNTVSFTRDAARQVSEEIDPLSQVTRFAYNSRGWLVGVIDPAQGAVYSSYNSEGWLEATQESGGGTVRYSYDDLGRLTAVTDPLNNTTAWEYDAVGNLVRRTDALGHFWRWTYDEQNRVTSETDAVGNTTTFAYDLKGNLTTLTDPLHRTTRYTYDAQDRRIAAVDPAGAETTWAYDLAGRLASVTDANGNVTSYRRDANGRVVAEFDPLGHETHYAYDAAEQLVSQVDRRGRQRTFVYDGAGRRIAENWLDSQGAPIRTIGYAYDAAGRLVQVTDPDASYAFAYDSDGRLIRVDNAGTPGMPHVVLASAYDVRDNRISLGDNLGGQIAFAYDLADRLTAADLSVAGADAHPAVTLGYDAAGRLANLRRVDLNGGGSGGEAVPVDTSITYDAAGRIVGLQHTAGGETLAGYAWTWDAAGQLVQEVSNDGTAGFGYDVTGQLTAVTGWRTESYEYDALGNRTMPGYRTGAGNRLLSDGTFDYTYDHEGNLLTKTEIATGTTTEYTWDHRNRLTGVVTRDAAGTVIQESRFTYDPLDKRIGASVDPDGEGPAAATQTWTVYDGENPYADFDGQGQATERYLYGDVVDMALARLDAAGELVWYLADHLGTVRDLAGVGGSVVNHVCYDSYGRVLSETDPAAGDRFKFTGREYDSETGLYYYRARYYDPATGRFVSEDPIDFSAGDANIFRYVFNAPASHADPTGLAAAPPQSPGGKAQGEVLRDPRSVSPVAEPAGALIDFAARGAGAVTSPKSLLWSIPEMIGDLIRAWKGVDKAFGAGRRAADKAYRESFPDGHAPPPGTFEHRNDSGK